MFLDSEHAPGGIIVYYADGDEEIIHVNQYVIDLFECATVDEFLDHVHGSFRGFVHGDDIGAAEDSIWGQVCEQDSFDHIYYRIETKSGRLVSIEDFGRLIETSGSRPVFHVFIAEVTQGYAVDWLTGLPDMSRFQALARMGVAIMEARGERPAVLALDLIGLKSYNTQYGRDAGDRLLQAFADVLRKHFGSEACSRFAEDHFYAFASTEGLDERLEDLFSDFTEVDGHAALPVRVGVYACDPGDDIVGVALDRAKIACDLDRKTWRSHAVWFSDDLREAAQIRIYVLEHIDDAIAEGWIRPYYQPIVRAATGYVCGEEALARWIDPVHGALSPAQFVPVLEEAGLLYKLDMCMVDRVLEDMAVKKEHGITLVPVSVNLSQRDLQQLDIVEEVVNKTATAGVPHEFLKIEFTESAASINPEYFRSQVNALRAAGFHVWMDDFGSEYSSLNTLHEYAFDLIKLDMGFMDGFPSNKKTLAIIEGVVRTAGVMGINTLSEGVEKEEQAIFLEGIGCDMLQGYLYTTPLPIESVIEMCQSGMAHPRELPEEAKYWNTIGTLSLVDPSLDETSERAGITPLSEVPVGVIEFRDGEWRILRSNRAYREFLDDVGVLPRERTTLQAHLVEGRLDEEFGNAAARSLISRGWEMVAGRLEDGSGLQFYIRPVASVGNAKAFKIVGMPTLLGSGLGTFGDVPVSYAVLRIILGSGGDEVIDAEHIYANRLYCDWFDTDSTSLIGRSFREVVPSMSAFFFPYFYRAVVLGEEIRDTVYSPEIGHWLSFNLAPSPVAGHCVCAFTVVDDERREHEKVLLDRDTSEYIISIADALHREKHYEIAMQGVLDAIGHIVQSDRVCVFELVEDTVNTFEWCAEGIEPAINTLPGIDVKGFGAWEKQVGEDPVIVLPDTSVFERNDPVLYEYFKNQGITRLVAVPLYGDGELIGYLSAENFRLDAQVDTVRLIGTIASFIGIRMVNHRLSVKAGLE